jgi:hypothetical protein
MYFTLVVSFAFVLNTSTAPNQSCKDYCETYCCSGCVSDGCGACSGSKAFQCSDDCACSPTPAPTPPTPAPAPINATAGNWASLRSAVPVFGAVGGTDLTISLKLPFVNGDYDHGDPNANPFDKSIVIWGNTNVTILGNGAVLDAAGKFFTLAGYISDSGSGLALHSLTLQNGLSDHNQPPGGAIFVGGGRFLKVTHTNFINNTDSTDEHNSMWGGGAIFSQGFLTVDHSIFTFNKAGQSGGAIGIYARNHLDASPQRTSVHSSIFSFNEAAQGGAICSAGPLTITSSLFTGNKAKGVQYRCGGCNSRCPEVYLVVQALIA